MTSYVSSCTIVGFALEPFFTGWEIVAKMIGEWKKIKDEGLNLDCGCTYTL